MENNITEIIRFFYSVINIIGFITTLAGILTFIGLVFAALKGLLLPLWRLGLGLSRRKILIDAEGDTYHAILNLLKKTKLFREKKVTKLNRGDVEMISEFNLIIHQYSNTESLKKILNNRQRNTPLIVYAKQGEIKDPETWLLLDSYTNTSLCNLKGRLINDVLVSLMSNAYVK